MQRYLKYPDVVQTWKLAKSFRRLAVAEKSQVKDIDLFFSFTTFSPSPL